MIETGKTYLLRLSGGHEWDLMATADEARLVERIASVMELKEGASGNAPRIIVRRGGSREKNGGVPLDRLEPRMREGLPREGWRAWNSGEFLVWFNAETEDAVFHTLGDTKNRQEYQRVRLFLFPVCRKVILSGGMTVHAALAERGGAGVIMAGQSQKGKSTACRRLTPPWRVLGDEEALVIRDHEGGYFAHPFPTWSDIYGRKLKKSWDVQCSVPMSAIFFLEQADRVAVEPIGKAEAAVRLCHLAEEKTATGWWCVGPEERKALRQALFVNACDIVRAMPAFTLRTNLAGRFWEAMEEALWRGPHSKEKEREFKGVIYEGRSGAQGLRS